MNKSLSSPPLAIAILASLALMLLPGSAAAAKSCRKGSVAWAVNKKTVCLKTAKAPPGHAALEDKARLASWYNRVKAPVGRKPYKLPRGLAKAGPRAGKIAATLLDRTAGFGTRLSGMSLFTAASGSTQIVETMNEDGPSQTVDGVTFSSHVEAWAYADGTKSVNGWVSAKKDGYEMRMQPIIDIGHALVPEVNCPTADGKLAIDHSFYTGGTVTIFDKGKLLGGYTMKVTKTLHARGQVGRDALLHEVRSSATLKSEIYARGMQVVSTVSGDFTISRDGDPVRQGPLNADVKAKVAGATRAQERVAENESAAGIAADKDTAASLASQAEIGRWEMKRDEHKWYDLPNACANLDFDTGSIVQLSAGKTKSATAVLRAQDGGEGAGDVKLVSVSRGSMTIDKPVLDPGSPARLTAKAVAPDANDHTVTSELLATTTAGRDQTGWYGEDTVDLPKKLSGVIASTSTIPGASYTYFHASAEYTLDQVYNDASGYVSAFYKLTSADQDEVQNDIGAGCRYVGKGAGGTIADGDIEFRKPPGGKWQYAVMYDVELAGTYVPTDCGSSPMQPFSGDIVGFVNMAMLGGGFEDVGENFHLEAILSHTDESSQRKTVADWNFDPDAT